MRHIWKEQTEGSKRQLWNCQVSSDFFSFSHSDSSGPYALGRRAVEDGHTQAFLPTVAAVGFWPVLSGRVKSSAWYQQKLQEGAELDLFACWSGISDGGIATLIFVSEDGAARGKTDAVFLLRSAAEPISSRVLRLTSKEQCSILRCWWAERKREMVMRLVWDIITLNRWW